MNQDKIISSIMIILLIFLIFLAFKGHFIDTKYKIIEVNDNQFCICNVSEKGYIDANNNINIGDENIWDINTNFPMMN